MEIKIRESLKFGWAKTKENLGFIVAFELLVCAVSILAMEVFGDGSIVGFIVSSFVGFIFSSVFIRISRGEKVDLNNLFTAFSGNKFFHYFLATLVITLFVLAGVILLIVPGIIIAIATCFAGYLIIDMDKDIPVRGKSFWLAIKKSYEITKGVKWRIFLFLIASLLVNLLGLIVLVVGLFVTIPLTVIAFMAIYNKLKSANMDTVLVSVNPVSNTETPQSSTVA